MVSAAIRAESCNVGSELVTADRDAIVGLKGSEGGRIILAQSIDYPRNRSKFVGVALPIGHERLSQIRCVADAGQTGQDFGTGGVNINAAFGYQALYSNTIGQLNTALGSQHG